MKDRTYDLEYQRLAKSHARLIDRMEIIAKLTQAGSRTLDEMWRDMNYACDTARQALKEAKEI